MMRFKFLKPYKGIAFRDIGSNHAEDLFRSWTDNSYDSAGVNRTVPCPNANGMQLRTIVSVTISS